MEDIILKYKKINPMIGYFELTKIFGLSINDLLDIFNIKDFKIKRNNRLGYYKILYSSKKFSYDYYEDDDGCWNLEKYYKKKKILETDYTGTSKKYKYKRGLLQKIIYYD